MRPLRSAATLALLCVALPAHAWDDTDHKFFPIQVQIENDSLPLFSGSDRAYTNGIRFSRVRNPNFPMPVLDGWTALIKSIHPSKESTNAVGGFALGQNLYTPNSISTPNLLPNDRPYGAVLYGSIFAQIAPDTQKWQLIAELQAGFVGPPALGKLAQTQVHRLIGDEIPQGWHNQIKFEPILNVNVQKMHQRTLFQQGAHSIDVVPQWGFNFGNLATRASVGATIRLGRNISGFPIGIIGPTADTVGKRESNEFYFFGGAMAHEVGFNIFLDGAKSHNISKQSFVSDLTIGFHYRRKNNFLTYTFIHRSSEFKGPAGTSHDIGNLTFGRQF